MNDLEEKIKDILDKECYEIWKAKRCGIRDRAMRYLNSNTACWICDRNIDLVKKIADVVYEQTNIKV